MVLLLHRQDLEILCEILFIYLEVLHGIFVSQGNPICTHLPRCVGIIYRTENQDLIVCVWTTGYRSCKCGWGNRNRCACFQHPPPSAAVRVGHIRKITHNLYFLCSLALGVTAITVPSGGGRNQAHPLLGIRCCASSRECAFPYRLFMNIPTVTAVSILLQYIPYFRITVTSKSYHASSIVWHGLGELKVKF